MKFFNYENTFPSSKESTYINLIIKHQGKLELIEQNFTNEIKQLSNQNILEESYFSAKIEGIILDYKKCKNDIENIKLDKNQGRAGDIKDFPMQFNNYAKILLTMYHRSDFFKIDTTSILAMFYSLFSIPANYKKSVYRKNNYQNIWSNKNKVETIRVSPVDAYETPLYLGSAINALTKSFETNLLSQIVNISKFFVDFLCIKPFEAGCGRIIRLFTQLLLYKTGFSILKYVSLSKIFEINASKYYENISLCCKGWNNNTNSYKFFIDYFLQCLIKAYDILFQQIHFTGGKKPNKTQRVYNYFKSHKSEVSKHEIVQAMPDISISTIECALHELKNNKKIRQTGKGRSTKYILL